MHSWKEHITYFSESMGKQDYKIRLQMEMYVREETE